MAYTLFFLLESNDDILNVLSHPYGLSCVLVADNKNSPISHVDRCHGGQPNFSWSLFVSRGFDAFSVQWDPTAFEVSVLMNFGVDNLEKLRSVDVFVRLEAVPPSLDSSGFVNALTSYEDFMTMRSDLSPHPDLVRIMDKIQLKRHLEVLGVAFTPVYHMSNDSPDIESVINNLSTFVAKPSHFSEAEYVFIIKDHVARHSARIRENWTDVVDFGMIQTEMRQAFESHAYEWETNALVMAQPGVIIEKLVLATPPGRPERVEEIRCHAVWGSCVAVEYSFDRAGHVVFTKLPGGRMKIASVWADENTTVSIYEDIQYISDCLQNSIDMAEQVANGFRADHIRVDLLVEGDCEAFFVSEVELFCSVPFNTFSQDFIASQWRYGYGF